MYVKEYIGHTIKQQTLESQNTTILYIQGVPEGNVPDFGIMFLKLKYTDITQNTYI